MHGPRRSARRQAIWDQRQRAADTLLFVDDVIMAFAHLVDFPASTDFWTADAEQSPGVRHTYVVAWTLGTVFILGGLVGSAGTLSGGQVWPEAMKKACDGLIAIPIVLGTIGATVQVIEEPNAVNGFDALIALVQGVTDFEAPLGAVLGSKVLPHRIGLNLVGNLGTGALLGLRSSM